MHGRSSNRGSDKGRGGGSAKSSTSKGGPSRSNKRSSRSSGGFGGPSSRAATRTTSVGSGGFGSDRSRGGISNRDKRDAFSSFADSIRKDREAERNRRKRSAFGSFADSIRKDREAETDRAKRRADVNAFQSFARDIAITRDAFSPTGLADTGAAGPVSNFTQDSFVNQSFAEGLTQEQAMDALSRVNFDTSMPAPTTSTTNPYGTISASDFSNIDTGLSDTVGGIDDGGFGSTPQGTDFTTDDVRDFNISPEDISETMSFDVMNFGDRVVKFKQENPTFVNIATSLLTAVNPIVGLAANLGLAAAESEEAFRDEAVGTALTFGLSKFLSLITNKMLPGVAKFGFEKGGELGALATVGGLKLGESYIKSEIKDYVMENRDNPLNKNVGPTRPEEARGSRELESLLAESSPRALPSPGFTENTSPFLRSGLLRPNLLRQYYS